MSSQLLLAAQIAQLDRDQLETLIRSRALSNPASIEDPLDLAGALLKPDSIRKALAASPRGLLTALTGQHTDDADAGMDAENAVLAGLAVWKEPSTQQPEALVLLPEVSEVLTTLLDERGLSIDELNTTLIGAESRSTEPSSVDSDSSEPNHRGISTELAFETVRITSQLLRALRDEGGATRVGTTPNAATTKRLAAEVALEPESVSPYVRLLEDAGILQFFGQRFWPSARVHEWQTWSRPQRYAELISAWFAHTKPFIRAVLAASRTQGLAHASATLAQLYPLAPNEYAEELNQFLTDAQRFGVVVANRFSPVGAHLIAGEMGAAIAELEQAFPSSVSQVYLQPDLSIIAPGPLEPTFEEQLLEFAALESAGLASSYRISARTLETALSAGHTESSIREFLATHSLTGIPQPVDYLLGEASRRHGSIVVLDGPTEQAPHARSVLRCAEASLLSQLMVDRALTSLSLAQLSGTEAWTLFSPNQLADALRDAGYPVTLEGGLLASAATNENRDAGMSTGDLSKNGIADPLLDCAARVYDAGQQDQAGGSLERVLQLAVRQKQRLRVVMQQADGSEREFVLRSVGLSNGRFRGIDEQAEVERTLPVSQLSSVEQLTG